MTTIGTSLANLKGLLSTGFSGGGDKIFRCASCNDTSLYRIRRNFYMRLLGVSEHYACSSCDHRCVRWMGRLWRV